MPVYQFQHLGGYFTKLLKKIIPLNLAGFFCDLAGARTQDPLLKREMLYQLSYQVNMVYKVTWLGLEPRTLSLKGRCSLPTELPSQICYVPRTGLEPARPKVIRPSSVRVYQFRHLGMLRTLNCFVKSDANISALFEKTILHLKFY